MLRRLKRLKKMLHKIENKKRKCCLFQPFIIIIIKQVACDTRAIKAKISRVLNLHDLHAINLVVMFFDRFLFINLFEL